MKDTDFVRWVVWYQKPGDPWALEDFYGPEAATELVVDFKEGGWPVIGPVCVRVPMPEVEVG